MLKASEITIAANQYIDDHPEIIAFATQNVPQSCCKWPTATPEANESCAALRRFAQRKKR